MLPTTHFLYLALGLFALGLGGAVLRRSLVVVLLSVQLMFAAVALLLCTQAYALGQPSGQAAATLVIMVGLIELGVSVAVIARILRSDEIADLGSPAVPGSTPGRGALLLIDWTGAAAEVVRKSPGEPSERPTENPDTSGRDRDKGEGH